MGNLIHSCSFTVLRIIVSVAVASSFTANTSAAGSCPSHLGQGTAAGSCFPFNWGRPSFTAAADSHLRIAMGTVVDVDTVVVNGNSADYYCCIDACLRLHGHV